MRTFHHLNDSRIGETNLNLIDHDQNFFRGSIPHYQITKTPKTNCWCWYPPYSPGLAPSYFCVLTLKLRPESEHNRGGYRGDISVSFQIFFEVVGVGDVPIDKLVSCLRRAKIMPIRLIRISRGGFRDIWEATSLYRRIVSS